MARMGLDRTGLSFVLWMLAIAAGATGCADDAPPSVKGTESTSSPIVVGGGTTAKVSLAAGGWHACAILEGGQVKCWGENGFGQLGLGDTDDRGDSAGEMGEALPSVKLGAGRTAKAITAGQSHTCSLLDNDTVKCWGYNFYGQLGKDDTTNRGVNPGDMDVLTPIALGSGIPKAIAAGEHHTCALLVATPSSTTGQVRCWGSNSVGQLGLGSTETARGDAMGDMALPGTVSLGTNRSAKAIAAKFNTTCALLDNDRIKCWGYNFYGQLGQNDKMDRGRSASHMGDNLREIGALAGTPLTASTIAVGRISTCALLTGGEVKCWGRNDNGTLGREDTTDWGDATGEINNSSVNFKPAKLGAGRAAVSIDSDGHTACAVLDNGQLKCWGFNGFGQLGAGNLTNRGGAPNQMGDFLPAVSLGARNAVKSVAIGAEFACAMLDNGNIKCWGKNDRGQLGLGGPGTRGDEANEMGDLLPLVQLGARSTKHLGTGDHHACAVLADGQLKCWGHNGGGQLGVGDLNNRGSGPNQMGAQLSFVDVGAGRAVKATAGGDWHTCALLEDGRVKCWGANASGQLGVGDTNARGDSSGEMGDYLPAVDLGSVGGVPLGARALSAGAGFTCALLSTNQIKCWGDNNNGRLGLGATGNRGAQPGQMGNALQAVQLGTNRTAKAIVVGGAHACALLDNDQVKCWGYNGWGQLGIENTIDKGSASADMGDNLQAVNLGTAVKPIALAAGEGHNCALFEDGRVKCWGQNLGGQCGTGQVAIYGNAPGTMAQTQFVDLGAGRTAKAIAARYSTTCAVLDNGQLKCWGWNDFGQLGRGYPTTEFKGDHSGEMGDALLPILLGEGRTARAVAVERNSVCAVLDNGQVKCWGRNEQGQLGIGTTAHRGGNGDVLNMPPTYTLPIVDLGLETNRGLTYLTTWIGNTWGKGHVVTQASEPAWVPSLNAIAVKGDGTVFTNTFWDEGGCAVSVIPPDGSARQCFGATSGGVALAINDNYMFLGHAAGVDCMPGVDGGPPVCKTHGYGAKYWGVTVRSITFPHHFVPPFTGGTNPADGTGTGAFLVVNGGDQLTPYDYAKLITSVAATNNRLLIANPYTSDIKVYSVVPGNQTAMPPTPPTITPATPGNILINPAGWKPQAIAIDASEANNLRVWAIVTQYNSQGDPIPNMERLQAYRLNGSQWQRIFDSSLPKGAGLAFDKASPPKLLVAESGASQQVKKYTVSYSPTTTLTLAGTLGTSGGIYGGVSGVVGPSKLVSPYAVGAATDGSIVVANRMGGTDLRRFNAAGQLQWKLKNVFPTAMVPDPTTDGTSFYDAFGRYTFDYLKQAGQEWSHAAVTVQAVTSPQDPRLTNPWLTQAMPLGLATVGSTRLLAVTGLNQTLILRFDGEIATPTVLFANPNSSWPYFDPAKRFYNNQPLPGDTPAVNRFIWSDTTNSPDGGLMQTEEFVDKDPSPDNLVSRWVAGVPGQEFDADGNFWEVVAANFDTGALAASYIRRYGIGKAQCLQAPGPKLAGTPAIPQYSRAGSSEIRPTEFTNGPPYNQTIYVGVQRVRYVKEEDALYVTGYTHSHPAPCIPGSTGCGVSGGDAGSELIRYATFCGNNLNGSCTCSTANPTLRMPLPLDLSAGRFVSAFAVAGDRVFAVMRVSHGSGSSLPLPPENVHVYDRLTGRYLGELVPGPEVDRNISGIFNPIHAYKRSTGEYVVTVQDVAWGKSLVYRGTMNPY
jgi:alpha-tubulin suppressor-like RCC1 family protein